VVLDAPSAAGTAYEDAVARLIGEQVEMRMAAERRPGLVRRLLGRTA
jgi:septum site-determining protein MinD